MMAAFDRWVIGLSPGGYLLLWLALILTAVAGVILGMYYIRRARWIKDTATSKIRSAHQGFVELEGVAIRLDDHLALKAPLSGTDCVWFDIRVEKYRRDYDNKSARWETIVRQTSDEMIKIDDGTGSCLIDPEGATVYPGYNRTWRGSTEMPPWGAPSKTNALAFLSLSNLGNEYRYTEKLLLERADLYVLGQFKTLSHNPDMDVESKAVALLKEWKQDPTKMQRFDLNNDGKIDMREWEWARRLARAEARKQQDSVAMDESEIHTMSKPSDGRPFILSGIPQKKLVKQKRRLGLAIWGASVVVFGFWVYVGDLRGMPF